MVRVVTKFQSWVGVGWKGRSPFPLLAILSVAALTRLNHLTQPFVDMFSWRQSSMAMMAENFYRRNPNIFFPEISWHGPGPTYNGREFQTVSYLASLLYRIVGQHDWIGRGVAVLFGVWGVFALYQLARRVWDEPRALASAAMLAVMPGAIFIDRSFLPDPAMVALMTTSLWFLVDYLHTLRNRDLVWAMAIGTWGVLTKLPGLIVGVAGLYAIATIFKSHDRLNGKSLRPIVLAAGVSGAIVVAYYLWARHLAATYPPYHFAGEKNWLWDDGFWAWLKEGYFLPKLAAIRISWLWSWPLLGLAGLGLWVRPPMQKSASYLFHGWLLGCGLYYVIGAQQLVRNPWNFQIFNPAIAALAGHVLVSGLEVIHHRMRSRMVVIVAASAIGITITTIGHHALKPVYSILPYHDQSYQLGLELRQASQPTDLAITLASSALGDPNILYYAQRRGWVFPPGDVPEWELEQIPDDRRSIQLFDQLRSQGARWLVIAEMRKDFWSQHPLLVEHIKRVCQFYSKTDHGVIYYIPF